MVQKLKFPVSLVLLAMCIGTPTADISSSSRGQIVGSGNVTPEDTVILSNEMDARFSRDFSVLLKHLRLEWIVLDTAALPDSIHDKNLVLLGHPDAAYIGGVIRGMLTKEEVEVLRAAVDHHVVLEKQNPWMEDRSVYICSGADRLLRKNAVEEVMRAIIAGALPASDWLRTTYEAELDESVRDYVTQLQYEWDDTELPLQDLMIDVGANPRRKITSQQATEDVDRLFYLFSHGYSGYAFFNQQGEFEQAKERILQELSSQSSWSSDDFSNLLHDYLVFIVDCHLTVGDNKFAEHRDFWYDTQLELMLGDSGYQFVVDNTTYTVVSINDTDPESFILPSLNQQGEPIYRLGILSNGKPSPLRLTVVSEEGERPFEIELHRSDFEYYSEELFREDILGGIPVVRVRSFSDYYADELNQFVRTAGNHRGEPVLIIDIRGNGGGNEHWPVSWIQGLTGQQARAVFISSELESGTSMIGRANAFNFWYSEYDMSFYSDEIKQFTSIAENLESGARQAGWTGARYPHLPLVPNDTTVIVITNGLVASAGEGLVLRISQVENVVVVGENTMGALTFGNLSAHQLPHSRLMIWMPINFGLFLDQEFREGVGLAPDLWVPAADAVNYTVAAVRRGTITTSQPLTSAIVEQDFTPEDPFFRDKQSNIRIVLVVIGFAVGGLVWAFFMRKKPRFVIAIGGIEIVIGSIYTFIEKEPLSLGFLLMGAIFVISGSIHLLRERQASLEPDG